MSTGSVVIASTKSVYLAGGAAKLACRFVCGRGVCARVGSVMDRQTHERNFVATPFETGASRKNFKVLDGTRGVSHPGHLVCPFERSPAWNKVTPRGPHTTCELRQYRPDTAPYEMYITPRLLPWCTSPNTRSHPHLVYLSPQRPCPPVCFDT